MSDLKVLQFRVSDDERELIRFAAWQKKMSMQQWLRQGAVGGARKEIEKASHEPLPSEPPALPVTYDTPESVKEKLDNLALVRESTARQGIDLGKKTFSPDPK